MLRDPNREVGTPRPRPPPPNAAHFRRRGSAAGLLYVSVGPFVNDGLDVREPLRQGGMPLLGQRVAAELAPDLLRVLAVSALESLELPGVLAGGIADSRLQVLDALLQSLTVVLEALLVTLQVRVGLLDLAYGAVLPLDGGHAPVHLLKLEMSGVHGLLVPVGRVAHEAFQVIHALFQRRVVRLENGLLRRKVGVKLFQVLQLRGRARRFGSVHADAADECEFAVRGDELLGAPRFLRSWCLLSIYSMSVYA